MHYIHLENLIVYLIMKKILAAVAAFAIVGFNGFMLLEGSIAQAVVLTTSTASTSQNWDVTLDVTSEIALSCALNTTIDLGTISGLTGGDLQADRSCNVETNNFAGWRLSIHATGTPAMTRILGGDSFADLSTSPGGWANLTGESHYGFSAFSTEPAATMGASQDTYSGFNGTTDIAVADATTSTPASGVDVNLRFRAASDATRNQTTGEYSSHVVVTAITL
jgi:hypothetical protein